MQKFVKPLSLLAMVALVSTLLAVPALAGIRPVVSGLSAHKGAYWGGRTITVYGRNFTKVEKVMFGRKRGAAVHVVSSTRLTVRDPWHQYGKVHVRVVTSSGWSTRTTANSFTFARPTMHSKIQGGLTASQEISISASVRRSHHGTYTAPRGGRWTAAMGVTAMNRAKTWLGLPYSWAGGNGYGPTKGVCAHNGGDLDCHIVGFDCSGLTQYAWWPYKHLVHYASTQHTQAGRYHPSIVQLVPGDLVFFSGYIAGGIGHTAVYAGGGYVVQAEQSGTQVMRSRLTDVIRDSGVYRGATRPLSTGKQAAGPVITSMTTQASTAGSYVVINGHNLSDTTAVKVGLTTVYSFYRRTSTQLIVKVPAHRAGVVAMSVSNPWGTVYKHIGYYGAPTLTAMSPTSGAVAGGTKITVAGSYLTPVSKVLVGTTAASFVHATYGRLTITMPAHAAGATTVRVYSRFGASNARTFTYVAPAPTTSAPPVPASVPPSSSSSAPTTQPAPTSSAPTSPTSPSSPTTDPGSADQHATELAAVEPDYAGPAEHVVEQLVAVVGPFGIDGRSPGGLIEV